MDEKITKTAQGIYRQNSQVGQFNAVPNNFHTHNNIDSPRISATNLSNLAYIGTTIKTVLTTQQILALHTTPVTLVPSPGANALIVITGITAQLNFIGTAYTGANNLEFRYTDGSGTKVTADMGSAFLNSASTSYQYVSGITTAFAPLVNKPIVVAVPTANPGAGTGFLTFYTQYRIITIL